MFCFCTNRRFLVFLLFRLVLTTFGMDIVSVTEVDWNNDKVIGRQVVQREEISPFYDISLAWIYGNGAMTYYQTDELMSEWFRQNIG